ncbi:MAG: hypothetical protein Q7R50_08100 [Dehalococcoidales bacterium]|nr:hypothetical protein [Dehalococcoidales bacterium]
METAPGNPERQARKALLQEAVKDKVFLKDIKDVELAFNIAAFKDRAKEPLVNYDEMVKRLKRDGLI